MLVGLSGLSDVCVIAGHEAVPIPSFQDQLVSEPNWNLRGHSTDSQNDAYDSGNAVALSEAVSDLTNLLDVAQLVPPTHIEDGPDALKASATRARRLAAVFTQSVSGVLHKARPCDAVKMKKFQHDSRQVNGH